MDLLRTKGFWDVKEVKGVKKGMDLSWWKTGIWVQLWIGNKVLEMDTSRRNEVLQGGADVGLLGSS